MLRRWTSARAEAGPGDGEPAALALDSPGEQTAVFSSPQAIPDLAHEWGWALLDQRFRAALESFATRAPPGW